MFTAPLNSRTFPKAITKNSDKRPAAAFAKKAAAVVRMSTLRASVICSCVIGWLSQIEASIAHEKLQSGKSVTIEDVINYLTRIRNGSEDNILYRQSLVNIYVDSIYLYDTPDGKNKKISVLLKTQNGVKEIPIDDLESSSMGQMVHHRGLEPRTH